MELKELATEKRNENSMNIDQLSTLEMVSVINNEDKKIADAVEVELPNIAKAIDLATERFLKGGRLIYIGAGTSGRMGAIDAIELTPTYSIPPERAFGMLAGGVDAMFFAVEGAEDSKELARSDLKDVELTKADILIAIAASGRTPYAIAALEYGNEVGALTISISCTKDNALSKEAYVAITPIVGPEVITGSTRMKAGTAQKMVANMLSTGIMIKTGNVYQNLMVNVQATNMKLVERSIHIISQALSLDEATSKKLFDEAGQKVNVAIVMYLHKLDKTAAEKFLEKSGNRIQG